MGPPKQIDVEKVRKLLASGLPQAEVARRLGFRQQSISNALIRDDRRRAGLCTRCGTKARRGRRYCEKCLVAAVPDAAYRQIYWDEQPLGVETDTAIAKRLEVSVSAVQTARVRRGIPAFRGANRGRPREKGSENRGRPRKLAVTLRPIDRERLKALRVEGETPRRTIQRLIEHEYIRRQGGSCSES